MADALAYLASLSEHPDRPGDTTNFNPAFSSALASALRQARAAGLPVGIMSGFREAGQTGSAYDAGGNSSHTYGLASDISGLDGPNGKITNAWAKIAEANGLHNPYGVDDAKEFNHWQLPPQPLEQTPELLASLKAAKATGDFKNVWNAYGTGQGGAPTPIGTTVNSTPFAMPANAPMGMQNNNPLNIKYVEGSPFAGVVGPSKNTDQGDPQMVFSSPEAGWSAAYQLLNRKYGSGMTTPAAIIAGKGGWTPGNMQAAENVAKSAGIGVNDDIGFSDPGKAAKFMRALVTQEQGGAGSAYSDAMIANAISGKATPTAPLGTSINTTGFPGIAMGAAPPRGGSMLPGFSTSQASDQFLQSTKGLANAYAGQTDQGQQQQQPQPSPMLPTLPVHRMDPATAMQMQQKVSGYTPYNYGTNLASMGQPMQWGSGSPFQNAPWANVGQQQAGTTPYGASLNSTPMMDPMMRIRMMDPTLQAEMYGYG